MTDSLDSGSKGFFNSGWAKVMMVVMSSHSSHVIVQFKLLYILWSIGTASLCYTFHLVLNAQIHQITKTMKNHQRRSTSRSTTVTSSRAFAAIGRHAMCLLMMWDRKFFHQLMVALYIPGGTGNREDTALWPGSAVVGSQLRNAAGA